MAIRDLAISRGASTLIFDPLVIQERSGYNTRDMESESTINHIREMANSILESGNDQFPPITIYQEGESLYVMAGWCRRRAHILAMEEGAPIKGIMCISTTKKKPEDIALNCLSSNDGLPLTALEKAKAVKKLQSYLWTASDIAKKTGWSISTVNNLIALHDAPDSIHGMVRDGSVSATLATKLVKEKGAEAAEKELTDAVESSKATGKRKTTQKDIDCHNRGKQKKVNWSFYGPKLLTLLKAIYECPITDKNKLMGKIADAGELLAEIEDRYPEEV